MIYGCFLCILTMTYYRPLGIVAALIALAAAVLGWSALGSANTRRGLVTLIVLAIGLKLAHWGCYAPEWNYRLSQGPWGRAIGQWIPRKWPVYTFHDWPPDLAFFIGRPVRQLHSPEFLNHIRGPQCRFVLLQVSEFDNWPAHAPPLTRVARFQDRSGEEPHPGPYPRTHTPVPGQNVPWPNPPEPLGKSRPLRPNDPHHDTRSFPKTLSASGLHECNYPNFSSRNVVTNSHNGRIVLLRWRAARSVTASRDRAIR